jgi:hypothetical protein
MKHIAGLMLMVVLAAGGCVVRELTIRSEPPGATVYINGREAGKTPHTETFDFYGSREVVLRNEGYLTASSIVQLKVPWYELFPLDLVSEILLPVRLHNRHEFTFNLKPLPERAPEGLLERAQKARANE